MKTWLFILLASVSITASGQGVLEREHPRVSELQDKMTEYARDYLKTRLPDIPFLVTVRIEPMRRQMGSNYRPQNERLPYLDLSEEEIRDEWDDPSASLYVLQSRVQKSVVNVSLPQALKAEEVQEIKDTLSILLRLTPGRDEVRIEQRSWSLGQNFWYYVGLVLASLVVLLLGMAFVSRSWAGKLAKAIHDSKPKETEKGESSAAAVGGTASTISGATQNIPSMSNGSRDLQFRDPIKTREYVSARVAELIKNSDFPSLQSMLLMDRLAERSPRDLGALLMEFPLEKQKELFSISYNPSWLNAFSEPGELSADSLELLDKLCRLQYGVNTKEWEQVLIQFWRLGADRVKFIKSLTKEEGFALLKDLPTSISVPVARIAYPGAWAVLLDPAFTATKLSPGRVKEIYWYGLETKPLLDFNALEKYRQEKDLLDYLQMASVLEERDIYEALPKESFLWQVRPPFYKVLETENDSLKLLFSRVTLDEWALALFNVARERRRPIEAFFNAKQKFLFLNKLRQIDQINVDKRQLGYARERIARVFTALMAGENVHEISGDDNDEGSTTPDKNDAA